MKVEINEEDLENIECSINFAIKASAILQLVAILDPVNSQIKLEDCLKANVCMSKCLDFIDKAKETIKNHT